MLEKNGKLCYNVNIWSTKIDQREGAAVLREFEERAMALIRDSYDLHVHSWPDHDRRSVSDLELLEDAERFGMAGVLIKNHYEPTAGRAALAGKLHRGKAKIFGSIALNWSVGGVNPYAAESAARMGAKMIWLPTRDAEASLSRTGCGNYRPRPALRVLDGEGRLLPEALEVLEVARDYEIPVSTGHISMEESFAVCRAGLDLGVRMVLSHPEYDHTPVSVSDQRRFAEMGVLIEKDWVDIALHMASVEDVANSICRLEAKNIYLATDRGQADGERPAEGLLQFVCGLLCCGIAPEDIAIMIRTNPRAVLRL